MADTADTEVWRPRPAAKWAHRVLLLVTIVAWIFTFARLFTAPEQLGSPWSGGKASLWSALLSFLTAAWSFAASVGLPFPQHRKRELQRSFRRSAAFLASLGLVALAFAALRDEQRPRQPPPQPSEPSTLTGWGVALAAALIIVGLLLIVFSIREAINNAIVRRRFPEGSFKDRLFGPVPLLVYGVTLIVFAGIALYEGTH